MTPEERSSLSPHPAIARYGLFFAKQMPIEVVVFFLPFCSLQISLSDVAGLFFFLPFFHTTNAPPPSKTISQFLLCATSSVKFLPPITTRLGPLRRGSRRHALSKGSILFFLSTLAAILLLAGFISLFFRAREKKYCPLALV